MTSRADDLVSVLIDLGVDVHKVQGDEINARCPVHHKVKGRESSRNSWYMNVDSGLYHCFTCGARGNLHGLVNELSGDPGSLWRAQKLIIDSGLRRLDSEEQVTYKEPEVDWVTYAKFSPIPEPVLAVRNLDAEVSDYYGLKWDSAQKCYITPIVSPLGQLWGWQAKKGKWVKNTPEGVNKSLTLFGIERVEPDGTSIGLLVESPMDVVRFHSVYGGSDIRCVSSFGANVSDTQMRLLSKRFDTVYLAMDNDKAGKLETKRLAEQLSCRKGIKFWRYAPNDPKDIGEMTDGQIIRGLQGVSRVQG